MKDFLQGRMNHPFGRSPEGRGKIERFLRTVREQFLVEVDTTKVTDVATMNRLFTA